MFMHAAIVANGNTINTLPAGIYPDGTEVRVVGDGVNEFNGPCAGGAITAPFSADVLIAGLPYKVIIEPNNPAAGSQQGSVRGKKQKINRVTLCFYESIGAEAGNNQSHLQNIPIMAPGTQSVVPHFETGVLYSHDLIVDLNGDWLDDATISIVNDNGMPFTLKAVIPHITVEEPK
jgi:hypothetical protein